MLCLHPEHDGRLHSEGHADPSTLFRERIHEIAAHMAAGETIIADALIVLLWWDVDASSSLAEDERDRLTSEHETAMDEAEAEARVDEIRMLPEYPEPDDLKDAQREIEAVAASLKWPIEPDADRCDDLAQQLHDTARNLTPFIDKLTTLANAIDAAANR